MEYKSFYKEVKGNEGDRCRYATRLDTYGCGCQHNCAYCYARSLLDFRGLWHNESPAVADIDKIKRTISKKVPTGSVIRLGGMTDCFQPLEAQERVTFETIKALNEKCVHYLIVTKSALVANNQYLEIYDRNLAHIQVSVTTTFDNTSREIEPRASLPEARIKAIEKLQEAGFDVQIRLSPFFPPFVNLQRIREIKCDKLLVEFLRVNAWIKRWLSKYDLSEYSLSSGGYWHLPLERKKELIESIHWGGQISVCEDVEAHQRYWVENVNANREDCCNLKSYKL